MNDIDLNLALVGRLLRCRWPVLAALAVLGALLGAVASLLFSPGYQSSCKVLLRGNVDKGAQLGEAQIASSLVVLDRTADGLRWGDTGSKLRGRISASVQDGNVIEIAGTASTPERAQQLTDRATREYIAFSTQIVNDAAAANEDVSKKARDRVQQQIDETQQRITELQASPQIAAEGPDGIKARDELDRARQTVEQAKSELEKLDEKQQASQLESSLGHASARVIEPPVVPDGAAPPTMVDLVAGGALVLVLLGVFFHLAALRSDRRVRRQSDIIAATGAPLLGTVEVAASPQTRRLLSLHDDRRWTEPDLGTSDDERSRASRFRRVLSRLRTMDGLLRVLILVPEDDPAARTAVLGMAVAAAETGRTVAVDTGDGAIAESVSSAAARDDLSGRLSVGAGGPSTHVVLNACTVQAQRPLVPPAQAGTATLLAVTAGTRTPWELAEIAAASREAGRPLAGVVVVLARVDIADRSAQPGKPGNAMAVTR